MPVNLTIPEIGESVTEAYVGKWLKTEGSHVNKDEIIAVLESEKANFDLPAPVSGTLTKVLKHEGDSAKVGESIGELTQDGAATEAAPAVPKPAAPEAKKAPAQAAPEPTPQKSVKSEEPKSPAPAPAPASPPPAPRPAIAAGKSSDAEGRESEAVQMSPMRQTIAKHLVSAQREAALLTTFNEIDMTAVKELRAQLREHFEQQHGVKLGFMSFFVKAVVDALKRVPVVNARIDGDKIVFHNYQDIGVAVSTDRGLVVPVLRNADRLSFAQIERAIGEMAERAAQAKLDVKDLRGGTFTITNGGVFGSLMSTPIVNPPQSGVLGMHSIQDRPIALKGQVVIRPMMYVALTYDHRIIDGKEAVSFLKRVKETIEQPTRMLLEV